MVTSQLQTNCAFSIDRCSFFFLDFNTSFLSSLIPIPDSLEACLQVSEAESSDWLGDMTF